MLVPEATAAALAQVIERARGDRTVPRAHGRERAPLRRRALQHRPHVPGIRGRVRGGSESLMTRRARGGPPLASGVARPAPGLARTALAPSAACRPSSGAARRSCRSFWRRGSVETTRRISTTCSRPTSCLPARCSRGPSRTRRSSPCSSRSSRSEPARFSAIAGALLGHTLAIGGRGRPGRWARSPPSSRCVVVALARPGARARGRDVPRASSLTAVRAFYVGLLNARGVFHGHPIGSGLGMGVTFAVLYAGARSASGSCPLGLLAGEIVAVSVLTIFARGARWGRGSRPAWLAPSRCGASSRWSASRSPARSSRGSIRSSISSWRGSPASSAEGRSCATRATWPRCRRRSSRPCSFPVLLTRLAREAKRPAEFAATTRRTLAGGRVRSSRGSPRCFVAFRMPLCTLLFLHGAMDRAGVARIAGILPWALAGAAPFGALLVLARAHVAQQNSRIMPGMGVLNSTLNAAFNLLLVGPARARRDRALDVAHLRRRGGRLLDSPPEGRPCLSASSAAAWRDLRPRRARRARRLRAGDRGRLHLGPAGHRAPGRSTRSRRARAASGRSSRRTGRATSTRIRRLHMALLTVALAAVDGARRASRRHRAATDLGGELIKPLYMTGIEVERAPRCGRDGARDRVEHDAVVDAHRRARGRVGAGVVVADERDARLLRAHRQPRGPVPLLGELGDGRDGPRPLRRAARAAGDPLLRGRRPIEGPGGGGRSLPLVGRPGRRPLGGARRVAAPAPAGYGRPRRNRSLRACVSGALVNPVGFRRRVAFLLGTGEPDVGRLSARRRTATRLLARHALRAIPHFTSWPIAVAAVARRRRRGASPRRGIDRVRVAPAARSRRSRSRCSSRWARAGARTASSCRRRSSSLPYAAVVLSRRVGGVAPGARRTRARWRRRACFPRSWASRRSTARSSSIRGTRRSGSSRACRRARTSRSSGRRCFFRGSRRTLAVVRPGTEPIADRQAIPGVTELVDPDMDPRPRAPDFIVLATALSLRARDRAAAAAGAATVRQHCVSRRRLAPALSQALRRLARLPAEPRRPMRAAVAARMPRRPRRHRTTTCGSTRAATTSRHRRHIVERCFGAARRMPQTWTRRSGSPAWLTTPMIAELADDVAHRSAGRVHVAHEGDESLFIFFDDDAHADFGRVQRERGHPNQNARRCGRFAQEGSRLSRSAAPATPRPSHSRCGAPIGSARVLGPGRGLRKGHDAHARGQRGLDPRERVLEHQAPRRDRRAGLPAATRKMSGAGFFARTRGSSPHTTAPKRSNHA